MRGTRYSSNFEHTRLCFTVYTKGETDRQTDRERQGETETDRQTHSHTDRQTDTQTDTQTDSQTDRLKSMHNIYTGSPQDDTQHDRQHDRYKAYTRFRTSRLALNFEGSKRRSTSSKVSMAAKFMLKKEDRSLAS